MGPQRNLATIVAMIESAEALPAAVKAQSVAVFEALANAEARAHGCALDDVHFHEVGAVDSIVDTVGAVLGFHLLGIAPGSLYCSALPLGHGRVWTQHGLMPVPVPATLELLRAGAIPTTPGPPPTGPPTLLGPGPPPTAPDPPTAGPPRLEPGPTALLPPLLPARCAATCAASKHCAMNWPRGKRS